MCIDGQRASALRFGDRRVQALFAALLRFDLLPHGFRNRELHEAVASLCGLSLDDYGTGRMIYDLRRLRLRGLIERIPGTPRHRLTAEGVCVALAYHRTQERVLALCCRPPSTGTRPHVFGKSSPSTTRRSTALGADRPWLRKPDLQVRKTADRTLIRNLTQL